LVKRASDVMDRGVGWLCLGLIFARIFFRAAGLAPGRPHPLYCRGKKPQRAATKFQMADFEGGERAAMTPRRDRSSSLAPVGRRSSQALPGRRRPPRNASGLASAPAEGQLPTPPDPRTRRRGGNPLPASRSVKGRCPRAGLYTVILLLFCFLHFLGRLGRTLVKVLLKTDIPQYQSVQAAQRLWTGIARTVKNFFSNFSGEGHVRSYSPRSRRGTRGGKGKNAILDRDLPEPTRNEIRPFSGRTKGHLLPGPLQTGLFYVGQMPIYPDGRKATGSRNGGFPPRPFPVQNQRPDLRVQAPRGGRAGPGRR